MKFRRTLLVLLAFAVPGQVSPVLAQVVRFSVPIRVTDGRDSYALYLGIVPNAHFCVDESDSIDGRAEFFLPPTPPGGIFDARFTWPRSGSNLACFDQGSTYDFRPYTSLAQRDTFRIKSQMGVGTTTIISWPHDPHLAWWRLRYFDQVIGQNVDVNMWTDTLADLSTAGEPATANIYAGGVIETVDQASPGMPREFALTQNYPNPFNPMTIIPFSIAQVARTEISVYDILGRKVTTLTEELLDRGYYNAPWDGRNSSGNSVASGVYFVRMTARPDKGAAFSALRKLLLMK